MLKPGDIAIVSGARTPFGRYCGKLKDFTAQELGAVAAKEAIHRAGVDPKEFDHAVFGNAQQTSGDAIYGARHVALRAGLPIETPALDRQSPLRFGNAIHRKCGPPYSIGRSERRSCRWHGSYVTGSVHYSRA